MKLFCEKNLNKVPIITPKVILHKIGMFINKPIIIPVLKRIVPEAEILNFDFEFKYEDNTPVIAVIGMQKIIIIKKMFASLFISWLIPGANTPHNRFKLKENKKAKLKKIRHIKIEIWLINFFFFLSSKETKYGIKDVDKPPLSNKLTIRSGNVKRITAISVCSLAPAIEESNHSLVKPEILPKKIKEATTIVEFFIDNFD